MPLFADSLTWPTFAIVVGGTGLTVLVLLVLLVVFSRRRSPSKELETMLRESSTRVEAMISDLTTALDHAHEQTARSKQLAEIGSTIDLDEVLARTLEAAGAILGVDGAMVVLDNGDKGGPLVATVGLSEEEAAAQPGTRDWGRRRAAIVSYLYPADGEVGEPVRGSVQIPIRGRRPRPSAPSPSSGAAPSASRKRSRSSCSRSSRSAPDRRSRTRGASRRPASSPTSMP